MLVGDRRLALHSWFGSLTGPGVWHRRSVDIKWKSVLGIVDRRGSRNMLAATDMTGRRSESRMPTDVPGNQPPARPVRPAGPIISAYCGQVFITGSGFSPNRRVTVRIAHSGDDVVDYLTYISDLDAALSAALPETAVTKTGHISVTDHRPDPAGDGVLLWSNTVIVTSAGM
jgi:hypothetical protein